MSGEARYDVKRTAGWSATRADGSSYQRATDALAFEAEQWFAQEYGGLVNDDVAVSGDSGYDVALMRRGQPLRVDVVHAGVTPDGQPRRDPTTHLIVNADSNKLVSSDVIVLVAGPPFEIVGAIYTARFVALASFRDFGYGPKLSLPSRELQPIDVLLGRRYAKEKR